MGTLDLVEFEWILKLGMGIGDVEERNPGADQTDDQGGANYCQ